MKLTQLLLPLFALALICLPLMRALYNASKGKSVKASMIANLSSFVGVCALAVVMPMSGVFAAGDVVTNVASNSAGLGYIAAALVTGLACIGAGIAVAAGAPAAIGAVSEDPKSFAKALIFVVLGEGIAIYGLLISILILNKI